MAADMFVPSRIVRMRRMGRNNWELVPPPGGHREDDCSSHIFREVLLRYAGRARRRWQHATISPISEGQGQLMMADGTALRIPSDDGMEPDLLQGTLSGRPPFGSVDASSGSAHQCGGNQPTPMLKRQSAPAAI